MKNKYVALAVCGLMAMAVTAARPDWDKPNYDKSKIAPYTLEDPLAFADGTKLMSPADWPKRRAEIHKCPVSRQSGCP